LLGVYLDEQLTLNKHVSHVCSKLSRANYMLRRVANFLTAKCLRTLYFSLFHSHLLYCTNILNCTSQSKLNRISILQRKAIRIITKSAYNEHTAPLFLRQGFYLLIKQFCLTNYYSCIPLPTAMPPPRSVMSGPLTKAADLTTN
jgi:hypothetical protein